MRAVVFGAWLAGRSTLLLRYARPADLLMVLAWMIRHPLRSWKAFHARETFPEVFRFLDSASRELAASGMG